MAILVVVLEIIGMIVIFSAMMLLLSGGGSKEHKLMEYFLCGSLVQNVGYLLEWTAPTMEAAVTAVKIEYVGCTFIPLLYCLFLYGYCYEKPPKKLLAALGSIDIVMLFFVFTCDRHSLFYRETKWVMTDGHGALWLEYGSLYPLFLLSWMIVPYVLSFYVLIRAVLTKADKKETRNYKAILLVSLLPIATYISYALKAFQAFDPTPLALGLGLSLVVILIWSRRNYDFRYMAAEMVLGSIADGVIALDDQWRLVSYNLAAAEIFPQLLSRRQGEYIGDLDAFQKDILTDGASWKFEIDNRAYESHSKQILSKSGKCEGYAVLVIDITDTQNYIEEIKRVRQQAEQANLAKSEFLANMSHEIRTPMNAIIGLSDLIMEESMGRKIYSNAQDIQASAKNLLGIINDILDLSKVEAGKMELVLSDYHIKSIVGEIVGMMDMAASQRGLLMKYEYDTSIPCRYRGDEIRIKQILINLLNNAIKFTKDGYVKISVTGKPGTSEGEEMLIFQVTDTGCGIREEDQEKIFEDFKQVDSEQNRSVEGTGLGLSITKHLVRLMNGSIELKSTYGQGSTFTVTIPQPIVDARPLSEVPEEQARELEKLNDFIAPEIKVLIVDDNKVNRKVARGFLKAYELDLTEAASGAEAIEKVKSTKFDIIFMDHMMPEMDGIEAVEHIRKECGENGTAPTIIALTANAMQGVKEKFLRCGFQDFIAKPLGRKPLNDILLRWIPEESRKEKEQQGGS